MKKSDIVCLRLLLQRRTDARDACATFAHCKYGKVYENWNRLRQRLLVMRLLRWRVVPYRRVEVPKGIEHFASSEDFAHEL